MQKLYIEGLNANGDYEAFVDSANTCHFVYAHGKLQDLAMYDIVLCAEDDDFDFRKDREEDVIAVLPNGKEVNSKLFFWHDEDHLWPSRVRHGPQGTWGCHGLVVASDDTEAIQYARERYEQKARFV